MPRYFFVLFYFSCVAPLYPSDLGRVNEKEFFLLSNRFNGRLADILLNVLDDQVLKTQFEIFQKRAELEYPQFLLQQQVDEVDENIQKIYEKRILVDAKLAFYYAKVLKIDDAKDELIAKAEKLLFDKDLLESRLEEYAKDVKRSDDAECEDELYGIIMNSDARQLEHCKKRIALLHKRAIELEEEMADVCAQIDSLKKAKNLWDIWSEDFHKQRADVNQLQAFSSSDGIKELFDQFDELVELSIATAYACPLTIFDRLVAVQVDADRCAWCIALLKIFQNKNPAYQNIIGHLRDKKDYCEKMADCCMCEQFLRKKKRVFNEIVYECYQQLKHDRACNICALCSNSVIRKENLLKEGLFVGYLEEMIPNYIDFRLRYVELFQKQRLVMNVAPEKDFLLVDLLCKYKEHMETLKHLLGPTNTIRYFQNGLASVGDIYSAFEGFQTKKDLSQKAISLLTRAQMQADNVLVNLGSTSCQSSSSSSSSFGSQFNS